MKIIIFIIFILLFQGCTFSKLSVNGTQDLTVRDIQYYENEQCIFTLGPFSLNKEYKKEIDKLIQDTIRKANYDGLNGNKLVNTKIIHSGYTLILFSKYCTKVQANLIYSK